MSKEIAVIEAEIEIPHQDMTVHYESRVLTLTSFSGGIRRGKSLQVTYINEKLEKEHFQLSNDNVQALKQILNENF